MDEKKSYPENLSLNQWADEDKPREKLLLKGVATLSDAELIAILLRSGSKNEPVVDLAKKILHHCNYNLDNLARLSVKDILSLNLKGMGETKAVTIIAAMEIGRRRQKAEIKEGIVIKHSSDIVKMIQPEMMDLAHEEFHIILLNQANKVLEKKVISSGGITGTVADIRLIFEYVLKSKAVSIILCHNHPSGNNKPSPADIDLTKKIIASGQMLDIKILDHIIIARQHYFSFADNGMM